MVKSAAWITCLLLLGDCAPAANSVSKLPGTLPAPAPSSLPTISGNPGPVKSGQWGGPHVSMDITETGATLQFDCATATIDQTVRADPDGFFRLVGKYTPQGGADPVGGRKSFEASYFGEASGDSMQVTVTYLDANGQSHSTLYTLEHDQVGSLNRCL